MVTRKALLFSILFHLVLIFIGYHIFITMITNQTEFVTLTLGNIGTLPNILPKTQPEPLIQGGSQLLSAPPPPTEKLGEPITFPRSNNVVSDTFHLIPIGFDKGYQLKAMDKEVVTIGDISLPFGQDHAGSTEPYFIEGRAAERRIISKVIPAYPADYQKEAIITLAFRILPSGLITSVTVNRKGDPLLEQIAVEAFRQWIFEAVPEKEGEQPGKITFVFKIK